MNEKQTKSIKVIEQSGRHLLALINDILDLAKIGSGYMELHIAPTAISVICESSLTMVRDMAWQKQLEIEEPKIKPSLMLDIDPQRLKQMLVNLLSNAVKFTPAGGRIGLDVIVDEQAETICFAVWDNGIGIASDKLPSLFTPFMQLDGGLSRQYEGTGLGLALVSQLASLHGGSVSVKSKVGMGSRFMVSLPFKPAQIPQTETAVSPHSDHDDKKREKRPFRILLVEDNPAIAESFSEYLEYLNYPVFIAHNGQMALDMLSEIQPHLILMDIQMPGMDGLETIRRIRALPEQQKFPIVAVTALAMKGDKERCLQAGATEYVSKPIGTTKLRELAQKYEAQHDS
jgi:CheY-like chemotaxis protein